MVHTATLTHNCNPILFRYFKDLQGTIYVQQNNTYQNYSLKDYGLVFIYKRIRNRDNTIFDKLSCRINFKKVIDQSITSRTTTLNAWEVDEVEKRFNELITAMFEPVTSKVDDDNFFGVQIPLFDTWKVHRIDYSIDVHTNYVEEYLNLLKKGNKPRLRYWYDENRNYSNKKGSLYLVSTARRRKNRSVTINFYDKYDERIKDLKTRKQTEIDFNDDIDEDKYTIEEDYYAEAIGDVLRLEIQCHKPKVDQIRKRWGVYTVKDFLNPYIAEDVISSYLNKIAGTADYNRKSIALEKIDQMRCTANTKDQLKKLINDIAVQHSSIDKVKKNYVENNVMSVERFNYLISTLNDYNINPVTIRSNLKLMGLTLKDGLPNLLKLFKQSFEDEMNQKE